MNLESIGIIINLRKFQENKYIVSCFTREHGVIVGLIRKISGKSLQSLIVGNIGHVSWYSRLEDRLGVITIESTDHINAKLHGDRSRVAILQSSTSMLSVFMTERDQHRHLFDESYNLLLNLTKDLSYLQIMRQYCHFELKLLEEIGFGLDLKKCVVSNSLEELVYVSPKSGCAVSASVGKPYHDKLLLLPNLLLHDNDDYSSVDIINSLKLTGVFLHKAAAEINKVSSLDVRNQLFSIIK